MKGRALAGLDIQQVVFCNPSLAAQAIYIQLLGKSGFADQLRYRHNIKTLNRTLQRRQTS
jgi:hypothetical protein